MGRLTHWTLLGTLFVCLGLGISAIRVRPAHAQVSVVSELWREWAVLQRQLRDARDEAARERRRLKARRAARARQGEKSRDE